MAELNWSDAQWQNVQNAVLQEFGRANVVSQVLPCFALPAPSIEAVRKEELSGPDSKTPDRKVTVTDDETIKLLNIRVLVELSHQQIVDESLASALLAFRRAANILAQTQDHFFFNGRGPTATGNATRAAAKGKEPFQDFIASGPSKMDGLVGARSQAVLPSLKAAKSPNRAWISAAEDGRPSRSVGNDTETLVTEVVGAIGRLEKDFHPGPFACILGTNLFTLAHKPVEKSMVLPADRINPLLERPLLRSGRLDLDTLSHGVVVSLAAGGPDIVVGARPKAQFLQITEGAKYVFRVYVRAVLRIKDPNNPGVRAFSI